MTHQPRCPLDGALDADDCPTCAAIAAALHDAQPHWQHVLADAGKREYARGWADGVNGRPASP